MKILVIFLMAMFFVPLKVNGNPIDWSVVDAIAIYVNTEENMQWFEKLAFARKIKGVTLREVESETGISNAYLSQLETGKIKDPGFFIMQKLLNFYNLDQGDVK